MLYEISALAGRLFALLWDCTHRGRNLAQEIPSCLRDHVDFAKAETICRAENPPPWIVCGLEPLKSQYTRPNRRDSLRFPIMRCNPLCSWLLCRLLLASLADTSAGLTIFRIGAL